MSIKNRHQNWCIQRTKIVFENNQEITDVMLFLLKKYYPQNTYKLISKNIDINFYTVRNWYQKKTGLNAYELWLMITKCEFIRIYLGLRKTLSRGNFITAEENTEEIKKNIIFLLKNNPKSTAKSISLQLLIPHQRVESILRVLRKDNKIKHFGPTKKGEWVIQ